MTIKLKGNVEEQLRDLAVRQDVREYIEGASITDLGNSEVAETQVELLGELPGVPGWTDL